MILPEIRLNYKQVIIHVINAHQSLMTNNWVVDPEIPEVGGLTCDMELVHYFFFFFTKSTNFSNMTDLAFCLLLFDRQCNNIKRNPRRSDCIFPLRPYLNEKGTRRTFCSNACFFLCIFNFVLHHFVIVT